MSSFQNNENKIKAEAEVLSLLEANISQEIKKPSAGNNASELNLNAAASTGAQEDADNAANDKINGHDSTDYTFHYSDLREVLPSDDPLDAPDFDEIEHINKLFPDEESLGDMQSGKLIKTIGSIRCM
ncbi:hypothetical protein RFI_07650 [Reticulomyxa filosa]|uniref:Uncharacterized protein n=1 Tax=Reticulomyxa filosa TaxID=46433 RepID=X6NU73_RETFI|nr:hypothetical protein RFI_07650 [Reticulomyxa filosa]|eukprot:ETO29473.1 hypothetical protein RFI_07650 [Reticulomyxa filosa]